MEIAFFAISVAKFCKEGSISLLLHCESKRDLSTFAHNFGRCWRNFRNWYENGCLWQLFFHKAV